MALRQGEVLWRRMHFVCSARGSSDGIPGRVCNVGTRVSEIDYIYAVLEGTAAHTAVDRGRSALHHIVGAVWRSQEWWRLVGSGAGSL